MNVRRRLHYVVWGMSDTSCDNRKNAGHLLTENVAKTKNARQCLTSAIFQVKANYHKISCKNKKFYRIPCYRWVLNTDSLGVKETQVEYRI